MSHVPFPLGIRDDTAIVIIEIYFPGHQFQNWRIWRPPSGKRASRPTQPYSAGRMWISAPGPASPVLGWFGRKVGSLDPGLTS